ncbi:MAG TPA: TonB-dependent receptor, partial [Polyangia bacterium]|nr:TonB-dependent receptor [Polyangia bacterium]
VSATAVLGAVACLPLSAFGADAPAAPAEAAAPDIGGGTLDPINVTGVRADGFRPTTVEAGTFRGSDIMEVPSTVNVVTKDVLERQAAQGLYDAVRNTAGVTRQQNGGDTWDQLVIRGIAVQNRTNYRLNGSVPIQNFSQIPLENKERVEVLKGASAIYYGFTSPAGIVNFVTKRATPDPVTSFGFVVDQYGERVATADVGRVFGDQQQFGLRVNAAYGTTGNFLDTVGGGNRRFISAAADWRVTDRLVMKADFEYDHRTTIEEAGVALPTAVNGVITIPRVVDPTKLVGPNGATFRTESNIAEWRADYAIADDWSLTLDVGHSQTTRDRTLPIFTFANFAALQTGAGSVKGNDQFQATDATIYRAELYGVVPTFGLRHELTLGISRMDRSQDPIFQRNYTIASQNLYDPNENTSIVLGARPANPTTAGLTSHDTGTYLLDRVDLTRQLLVYGGLRHTQYRNDQGATHSSAIDTTPMVAAVYRFTPTLSVYASWAKGVEEGDTAPTGTVNVGQQLAPGVSKQGEVGTRWVAPDGTLFSAAVFDIRRPGDFTTPQLVFVSGGELHVRGVELSTQGHLTRDLQWQTSAQYIDPKFVNSDPTVDGKLPENASRITGSAFLSYDVPVVSGLSFNAGAYFTGRRPVNDQDQAFLGATTLYGAGARYVTKLFGKTTTWQINVDNLFDKEYWAGAGTRFAAGAPRTVRGSFKVDL